MCSEPRAAVAASRRIARDLSLAGARRAARRSIAAGFAVATAIALAGCGKKGDPTPPPRTIAQPASDLTLVQRGYELVLEFAYPASTMAGLPLAGVDAVVVTEARRPATPAGGVPPIDSRELAALAQDRVTLTGSELASAIAGSRVTVRFRLEEPLPAAPEARFYAVRALARGGELSPYSNVASFVPAAPPAAPKRLRVEPRAEGVALGWDPQPGLAGFAIYRRDAASPAYGPPLTIAEPNADSYLDASAAFGRRYIYAVTAAASIAPRRESALVEEREIAYEDRFAPAPPARLEILPAPEEARLLWRASLSPDVVGYVVFRREPGAEEFRRLTREPVVGLEWIDRGLASGLVFAYRVAALDAAGNLGEPTTSVEARIP